MDFVLGIYLVFPSLVKGSERTSKDLEVSKHLDDDIDQEWSQISQIHKRYFYNLSSALMFC